MELLNLPTELHIFIVEILEENTVALNQLFRSCKYWADIGRQLLLEHPDWPKKYACSINIKICATQIELFSKSRLILPLKSFAEYAHILYFFHDEYRLIVHAHDQGKYYANCIIKPNMLTCRRLLRIFVQVGADLNNVIPQSLAQIMAVRGDYIGILNN